MQQKHAYPPRGRLRTGGGYSAVETVIAVGVLGMTVSTSLEASHYAHSAHTRAIQTLEALHIAESTIEKLRATNSTYENQMVQINQQFTEYLSWSPLGSGHQVTVTVEWMTEIGKQKVEIGSYIP